MLCSLSFMLTFTLYRKWEVLKSKRIFSATASTTTPWPGYQDRCHCPGTIFSTDTVSIKANRILLLNGKRTKVRKLKACYKRGRRRERLKLLSEPCFCNLISNNRFQTRHQYQAATQFSHNPLYWNNGSTIFNTLTQFSQKIYCRFFLYTIRYDNCIKCETFRTLCVQISLPDICCHSE